MEKSYDKQKERYKNNASDLEQGAKGSQTLQPPAFSLAMNAPIQAKKDEKSKSGVKGENRVDHQIDKQMASGGGDVTQLKTKKVTLPEKLGPKQSGPIAVKGKGDKHAFSPNDINQGSIGDCYFLAALAGVAKTNPGLLRKAITQNSDGTFTVRLYTTENKKFLWWKWKKACWILT